MGNSWRLTSDLIVYVIPEEGVYFAAAEKKTYQAEVLKLITGKPFIELKLENQNFNIKFSEALEVCVRSNSLPDKSKYYVVKNIEKSKLGELITQIDNVKGDFVDKEFEAIFSDAFPNKVFFTNPYMSQYKKCFEEMRRRMNCELCKKTRKWKPGHRYDTLNGTIYYLGEIKSRRSSFTSSEFLSNDKMSTAYLYVEEIDGEKKISEVLKSRCFGSEIKVIFTQTTMVDGGEELENDLGDFQDYWEDLIQNTEKAERKFDKYGNLYYENVKNIFSIFGYQSGTEDLTMSDIARSIVEDVVNNVLKSTLIKYWKYSTSSIRLNDKQTIEENTENLVSLFLTKIKDENILRGLYYKEFFEYYKISINNLSNKVILNWNEDDIFNNLDTYIKCHDYLESRYSETRKVIFQRENTKCYGIPDSVKVKDVIGDNDLSKLIIDIFEDAKTKYGIGISKFESYNIGSKKVPEIYIVAEITLEDIINHEGGIDKIPNQIKKDIMACKFLKIDIQIDKDKILE